MSKPFPAITLLALLSLPAAQAHAQAIDARPFDKHEVHRVVVSTAKELEAVEALGVSVWSCDIGVGPIDVQFRPEDLGALDAMHIPHQLRIPNVQTVLDAERAQINAAHAQRGVDWFATFRTLTEVNARMDTLATTYPTLVSTFSAGNSLEGRPMRGIRFSSPDLPNNPRSARPIILFTATQHAREWIAPMTAMYAAETLLAGFAGDTHIRSLLDKVEFVVIPVVNVDGYLYSWTNSSTRLWRKNRRPNAGGSFGVDTNRNFGYLWGGIGASTSTTNETFRGTGAFSEPETQVIRDFVLANSRSFAHIDFHSYGQYILSAWGYTSLPCPDDGLFTSINSTMESAIEAVHGSDYRPGPGYTTIYPTTGTITDWTYGDQHVMSWTIELRDTGQTGFVLPANQIRPTAEEAFAGVLNLADRTVSQPLWFRTDGGPAFAHPVPWVGTPTGLPELVQARQAANVYLSVKGGSATLAAAPTMLARVADSGGYAAQTMTGSGPTYMGVLPAAGPGRVIEYYFESTTRDGQVVRHPAGSTVFSTPAYDLVTAFNDTMETNTGWTAGLGADTATRGQWERAAPQNTTAQPGVDAGVGTLCYITRAAAGTNLNSNDVDGGVTTLISPAMNAATPAGFNRVDTRLTYYRWFSNDQGGQPNTDTMPISLSGNDGANYTQLEDVVENAGDWTRRTWSVATPTAQMRLKAIARDLGTDSCVEAGIDEVSMLLVGVQRSADYDGDGDVGTDADIEAFFRCLAGDCCALCASVDFDGDGDVGTDADIEAFFRTLAGG